MNPPKFVKVASLLGIFSVTQFSGLPLVQADTANPPRIQSVEIINSKVFAPGDVVEIKVNYTGGNPGLQAIVVEGDCIRSPYAYNYGWFKDKSQVEWFSFFQDLNAPQAVSDQIVKAVISSFCTDGVKKLYVTIEDETRLSDNNGQRGLENTFEVLGGHKVKPGSILPVKQSDLIDLSNIPATLTFDELQKKSYQLPRTSKNGQIIWWTAKGSCKVFVPFPLDAGGSLTPTEQGTCVLQADLFPVDLYFSPEVKSNVTFTKNNNWDYPKVGSFKVIDLAKASVERGTLKNDVVNKIAAKNKKTVTCIKGKLTKKVTAAKPKCPKGYKKK